jgi:hypothetical protein
MSFMGLSRNGRMTNVDSWSRRFRGRLVALAVVAAASTAARASADVTAAVVDLDRTAIGGALEAELLGAAGVRWVERTRLDLVAEERRLQTAFSPEGAAARLELGKLLSADALVLIRRRVGPKPAGASLVPGGPPPAMPRGTPTGRGIVVGPRSSMLRSSGNVSAPAVGDSAYELVVCETHRGLRTLSLTVTESKAKPLDIGRLSALVLERVTKAGEPVLAVYTVPPLLGRDLSYGYAHLQRSYAELITARLLALPGVAVVETAEARALTAERTVAGEPTGRADFDSPIFITGEFRHTGDQPREAAPILPEDEAGLRVRIQATARRGATIVGRPFDRELRRDEAAAALAEWADGLTLASAPAGAANARIAPPVDRRAEAARLFERAGDFLAWDNWDEAAAVAETGLLLAPDDVALHRLAYDALGRRFHDYSLQSRVRPDVWPPLREVFLRMCDHLDALVRHDGRMTAGIATIPSWYVQNFGLMRTIPAPPTDECRAIHAEISRKEAEVLQRFVKIRRERGFPIDAYHFLRLYLSPLPPEQLQTEMVRYILEWPQDRDARTIVPFMLHDQFRWAGKDLNPKLAILRELKTHAERPDLVALATRDEAATLARQSRDAMPRIEDKPKPFADLSRPGAPYRQIEWKVRRSPGASEPFDPLDRPMKFVRLGPNLDAARAGGELFLIREPGILDPLVKLDTLKSFAYEVEIGYDGRYIWTEIGGGYRGLRHLLVADPETGRWWRSAENFGYAGASNDDGRSNTRSYMNLTVLGPREAFIVARRGRTLMARVRFDPEAAEPFTLVPVLECPETRDDESPSGSAATPPNNSAPEAWRNLKLSFTADYVTPIPAAPGGDVRYLLVGRGQSMIQLETHPLLVDLRTNQVEMVDLPAAPIGALITGLPKVAERGGQAWFTARGPTSLAPHKFYRFDPVSRRSTLVDDDSAVGIPLFVNDETHVIGDRWWKKGPREAQFRRVTPIVPWGNDATSPAEQSKFDTRPEADPPERLTLLHGVYRSRHHGVIVCLNKPTEQRTSRYYYVELDVPAAAVNE